MLKRAWLCAVVLGGLLSLGAAQAAPGTVSGTGETGDRLLAAIFQPAPAAEVPEPPVAGAPAARPATCNTFKWDHACTSGGSSADCTAACGTCTPCYGVIQYYPSCIAECSCTC